MVWAKPSAHLTGAFDAITPAVPTVHCEAKTSEEGFWEASLTAQAPPPRARAPLISLPRLLSLFQMTDVSFELKFDYDILFNEI